MDKIKYKCTKAIMSNVFCVPPSIKCFRDLLTLILNSLSIETSSYTNSEAIVYSIDKSITCTIHSK